MKNLSHEEILEILRKIANGDYRNDLETLGLELRYLANVADALKEDNLA